MIDSRLKNLRLFLQLEKTMCLNHEPCFVEAVTGLSLLGPLMGKL